jgi:hypothetical protein
MDRLPTDSPPAPDPVSRDDAALSSDADRDARIEQLLLSGLDHYFAGQYERAISVWTRVVFLERNHDRAKAYIERARGAMAEQHREVEQLVGSGVEAYNGGDVETARDLLAQAADRGSDTAQLFLDRLDRVKSEPAAAEQVARPRRGAPVRRGAPARPRSGWMTAGALAVLVAAGMLLGGLPLGTWLSQLADGADAVVTQPPAPDPLPVVRDAEMALARARELHDAGRLRDALRALDRIDPADPLRRDADALRGQIQRDLLGAAGLSPEVSLEGGGRP